MDISGKPSSFHLVLIKPSHYDDDGYIIQWMRSSMPSNSLAAVYGLAQDCAQRKVLGEATPITVAAYDETNTRIRPDRLARDIRAAGGGMVGLVGVQSNQYPRAMDLARRFRARGINVASLAAVYGLAQDCARRKVLGEDCSRALRSASIG